ncbi:phage integrase, partial [Pseudomonas aeruginosa]
MVLKSGGGQVTKPKDRRRFSELVLLWYELHGHSLRDGKRRLSKLQQLTVRLGDPVGAALDASSYAQLRRKRLENGISGKTLNNELGYVRAVFNELNADSTPSGHPVHAHLARHSTAIWPSGHLF